MASRVALALAVGEKRGSQETVGGEIGGGAKRLSWPKPNFTGQKSVMWPHLRADKAGRLCPERKKNGLGLQLATLHRTRVSPYLRTAE